jgi:hypothetical protein
VSTRGLLSRQGERREPDELHDWLMLCLNFEAAEQRVAMMETHEGGHVFGKAFLTDVRLICTRRTPHGLYVAHSIRYLADVGDVVALAAEKVILLVTGPNLVDLVVRARPRNVSAAEFERFAVQVREGIEAC